MLSCFAEMCSMRGARRVLCFACFLLPSLWLVPQASRIEIIDARACRRWALRQYRWPYRVFERVVIFDIGKLSLRL